MLKVTKAWETIKNYNKNNEQMNKFWENCSTNTSEKPCEKTYEQSLRKFLKEHHLKIPVKITVSKKWLKSITEVCKDPLKKPVNNKGMNNNEY